MRSETWLVKSFRFSAFECDSLSSVFEAEGRKEGEQFSMLIEQNQYPSFKMRRSASSTQTFQLLFCLLPCTTFVRM